ncbi:hypothetical protein ACFL20_08160 [Spirochaetota bacterium]
MKKILSVLIFSLLITSIAFSQKKKETVSNNPIDIKYAEGQIIQLNDEIVKAKEIIATLEKENVESEKVIVKMKKYIVQINVLIKKIEAENDVFKKRFSPHVEDRITLEKATKMYKMNNENIFKLQTKRSESENVITAEERKIRANKIEIDTNKKFIANNQGKISNLQARINKTKAQKTDVNTHIKKSGSLSNETTKLLNPGTK